MEMIVTFSSPRLLCFWNVLYDREMIATRTTTEGPIIKVFAASSYTCSI